MNKEEREDLPSYGDLLAENFRLKHNENILQLRIDKAIKYIKHERFKKKILLGVSESKYIKGIFDNISEILEGDSNV